MTLEDAVTTYLSDVKPSLSLHQAMVMSWTRFREFLTTQGLSRLKEVAPAHVEAFHQKLLWEPGPSGRLYAANTVDYILRQVRNLMRWATERGHVALDPTRGLVLCRPLQPKSRLLTWVELQSILAAVDPSVPLGLRDAALYRLLAETDLGLQACLALNLRDQTTLLLEDKTAEHLRAYVDQARVLWLRNPGQRALFLNTFGGRLGEMTVGQRLDELGKIAGVDGNVTPRMLWRSYRAALAQSGSSRLVFPLAEIP